MDSKDMAKALAHTPADRGVLHELAELLNAMPVEALERFYRGTFNSLTVAHAIFARRFPEAFARVDQDIEGGDAPMKL